ncbi:MAG: hypothetical protein PHV36_06340 [Elusimicrobiales bacterium]|nr:hypothetical protein [Elusimicrobiales bacterium]
MRKGKIFITGLIIACCAAASAAAPSMIVLSSAAYDSGSADIAYALSADAGGNIFLTGNSSNNTKYLSQKYSKTLVLSPSAQQFFTPNFTGGKAKSIAMDGQGRIIVAGEEMNSSGNMDNLVLKYSPDFAALLSSAVYDGAGFDSGAAVKTDSQNSIFVAGYTEVASNKNFHVIKYSPELNALTTAYYDGGDADEASALAIDHNDNVIAAGFTLAASNNFLVVKYDNNLRKLYEATLDGAAGADDRATGLAVDSGNDIIVTGRQYDGTTQNYCTLKYNSFLQLISSAVYDSGGTDIPTGVAVDGSDNIIVTGQSANNYFTIKYDQNLNVISTASYDGGSTDISNAVAVDADDNAIVTGQSNNGLDSDYFTIKYNASPKITAVSPLYIGETSNVTFTGKGFLSDSAVSFQDTAISTGALSLSAGQITLSVAPSTAVILGVTTVTVTNANGEAAASTTLAYTRMRRTIAAGLGDTINAMTKLGEVTVDVPAGSFPYQETITIYTVPVAAGDLRQVGEALYFSVTNSSAPAVNASIKLRYSDADLGTYPAASLSLAYWDDVLGWVGVTSLVNTSAKSVTGFSKSINVKYAVVKEAIGSGGGGGGGGGAGGSGIPAKVYPNPYRPGSGGSFDQSTLGEGIVFAGLGANQAFKLTIVDLAGQLVFQKSATADSSGNYLWDTKTVSGGKVATGVYLYFIKAGGEPKKGKFSVIR